MPTKLRRSAWRPGVFQDIPHAWGVVVAVIGVLIAITLKLIMDWL